MSIVLALAALLAAEPDTVAIQAVHNFGACVAGQTPRGAREVLALDFRSDEYQKKFRAMIKGHDRCIPFDARLGTARLLFAGAMAEALIEFDVKAGELPQSLAFDPAREAIQARSPLEAMALCTVMKAPQATAKLFETEPATDEERQAMQPLGGVLGNCLKKDTKAELNKPALRSLLALAAWRIASAPKVGKR
jgi:hypothetical protein